MERVRTNAFRRHRVTRAFKGSECWVISPGNTQCLRKAEWDLGVVAGMNGLDMLEAARVRVAESGDRKVYMWPTHKEDPEGIELKRIGKNLWANLGPFLEEGNLALPVNTKERFRLVIVPEAETPVGVPNALCFDLNNPIERKTINRSKKKKSGGKVAE